MRLLYLACVFATLTVTGCRRESESQARDTAVRRQTFGKLSKGMSEESVRQTLGQAQEFRPGNGTKDDVAVYRVDRETFTLYFFNGRLTRVVSSKLPVNR